MKHIREIICKIFYKIGLKNAARRVCPYMYYKLSLLESLERVKESINKVTKAFESVSFVLSVAFPAEEREEK